MNVTVIGVAGGTGSGKSTLVKRLQEAFVGDDAPGIRQVAYALLTRAPVAIKVLLPHDAPRLACVKPVASVHPEPGSNSS